MPRELRNGGAGHLPTSVVSVNRGQPAAGRLGDVADVAIITKTSAKTVRRLIDAGKLPGVCRIGAKLIRVDLAVLDRWISQGCPPLSRFSLKEI
jgi:excisionase family DNA binding protein